MLRDNRPVRNTRTNRRGILLAAAAILAGILMAGCGGSPTPAASPQAGGAAVAGSFVGEIPDANAFVALVAATPSQAGEPREVRGYLCDGQSLSRWFTGSATGNELRLTSTLGDRLEGSLASDTATATITLADGKSFSFGAKPATGAAGLYPVTIAADGQVSGTSETGGRVQGRLSAQPVRDNIHHVDFTITAGGQTLDFRGEATAEPSDARFIVLPDGRVKGAKSTATTRDSGGYTNPDQDF